MRRTILLLTITAPMWGACAAPPYGNGYGYCREIAVNHLKVPNTDQTAFPVGIVGVYPWLRTTANGGLVQSGSGYDIIFTSDNAGTTLVNWEQVNYSATTGEIEYYVQRTLTTAADTYIYMFYGKAGVIASQSPGSPWDANFMAVWHFGSSSSLGLTDSTGRGHTLTNHSATAGVGIAGGGAHLVQASTQYLTAAAHADLDLTGTVTVEGWGSYTGTQVAGQFPGLVSTIDRNVAQNGYEILVQHNGGLNPNQPVFQLYNAGALQSSGFGGAVANNSLPYYLAGTYDNVNPAILYENTTANSANVGASRIGAGANQLWIGGLNGYATGYWDGWIDEVRISNSVRSADWVATTWYNLASPAVFYSMGVQVPAFTASVSCAPSANGYSWCRPISIDSSKVGSADQSNYPLLVCFDATMGAGCLTNDKELATIANGGKLANASGYDFIFTSDAAGTTALNYERVIQNLTTGAAEIWVQVPTLSHTAVTTIYLWYGNAGVVADQSNTAATWTNAGAIHHFTALSGAVVSVPDSSGNSNTLVNSGSVVGVSGQAGAGVSFVGAADLEKSLPTGLPAGTAVRTLECWANVLSDAVGVGHTACNYGSAANNQGWGITWYGGYGTWGISGYANDYNAYVGSEDSNWHYVVAVLPSGTTMASALFYRDGQLIREAWPSTITALNTGGAKLTLGAFFTGLWMNSGYVDESRIFTVAQGQDYVTTTYNMISNPSAMIVIGAEQAGAGGVKRKVMMQ